MPGAWLLKCRSRFSSSFSFFFGVPFFREAVVGAPAFCFLEETCISPSLCAIAGCFRFLEADFVTGEERVEGSSSLLASQFSNETFAAGVVFDFDLVFVYGEASGGWTPMIALILVEIKLVSGFYLAIRCQNISLLSN